MYDYGEMTGRPTPKVAALVSAIRAGEDTELELKEVVFRGDRLSFGADKGRATSKLAEVFVSMANTRGGTIFAAQNDALSQFAPGAGGGVEAVRQRRPRRGEPTVSTPGRSPAAAAGGWDSAGIEAALRRAAARARREAAAAGVPVVTFRDGEIVLEKPDRESGCAPSRRTDVDSPAADLEKPGREPAPHPGRGFPNPARDSDG